MRLQLPRVIANLLSMTGMRVLSSVLSFLLVVYVARVWGVTRLGEYSLLLSIFVLLQLMPLLGLHLFVIREVSACVDKAATQTVNGCMLALGVAVVLAVTLATLGPVVYRDAPTLHGPLWLVAASLIPTAFTCVAESVLIGQQRMHTAAGWCVAESLFRTGGAFIVILLGCGLTAVFAVFLAGRVLITLGYYRYAGFRDLLRSGRLERRELARYWHELPAFLGIMLCAAALSRMDVILLSKLGTLRDVGLYSAPYKLYEVALMAPSLLSVVFFPLFSSLFAADRTRFETLLDLTLRLFLFLGIPFVIGAVYLAPEIMRVYGPDYVQASTALALLMVGLVFVSVNQLLSMVMLVSHHQHLDFQSLALTCIAYAALLVATIPEWGFLGAAASTLVAATLQPLIRALLLRGQLPMWRIAGPLIKVGAAATAMIGVLLLASAWPAPAALAVGFCTYLSVVLLARGVTAEQVREYLVFLAPQPERAR